MTTTTTTMSATSSSARVRPAHHHHHHHLLQLPCSSHHPHRKIIICHIHQYTIPFLSLPPFPTLSLSLSFHPTSPASPSVFSPFSLPPSLWSSPKAQATNSLTLSNQLATLSFVRSLVLFFRVFHACSLHVLILFLSLSSVVRLFFFFKSAIAVQGDFLVFFTAHFVCSFSLFESIALRIYCSSILKISAFVQLSLHFL